jgi:hypothetical protein
MKSADYASKIAGRIDEGFAPKKDDTDKTLETLLKEIGSKLPKDSKVAVAYKAFLAALKLAKELPNKQKD